MQTTFKPNRQKKAAAINRNGVSSSTAVVKAAKKKATKNRNGRPISRGTTEGNFINNAGNKTIVVKITRKPRKFLHVAPKATASEIAKTLGITKKMFAEVQEIIDRVEKKNKRILAAG